MKTKFLVVSLLSISVLAFTGIVTAQTAPRIQSFNVTYSNINPNGYPNAYDVSYILSGATEASGVTVNADCRDGLTVQGLNDAGDLTQFTCGDIGAGGANGYFAYGQETLTLVFTNRTSQNISEAISISAHGMNTVTIYVNIPPAPFFKFTFPASDTNLLGGQSYNITWVNDNSGGYGYTAYLGTGLDYNGNNLGTIIRTIGAVNSNPEFGWVVPTDLPARSDYRIEFRGKGGGGGVTEPFSITAPAYTPPTYTPPPTYIPPSTPPTNPMTDAQRQAMIAQIQGLLVQLIQQLIALLNSTR